MKMKLRALIILACAMFMITSSALAHDCVFGPWKTKRNPTCRLEGLDFKYCTKCDHWEKRYIPKLPHTPDEWKITKEPTCTQRGAESATCTACGDPMRRYLDTLPHVYGEMTIAKEPTCMRDGTGEYICATCGRKKTETIDRLGHDWALSAVKKEATCKTAGSGDFVCQRCGTAKTQKIEKLEHVWNEWTITQEPSGQKKGVRTSTCTLCGFESTERFYWEGTLYQDMEANEDVIRLQEMLRDLGYYNGNIRSGSFGSLTGRAVEKFQKDHGKAGTQIADPDTRAMIEAEWEKKFGGNTAK